MISGSIGVPTPLELMLFDGATTKGVRAFMRKTDGTLFGTVDLVHIGEGLYTGSWTPADYGYSHVNYVVYTDGTYATEDLLYSRVTELYEVGITPTSSAISHAVWSDLLVGYISSTGSFGEAVSQLLAGLSPSAVAGAVWNEPVAAHNIPSTFGDYVQVIRHYVSDIKDDIQNPVWGLDMLYTQINNWSTTINDNVLLNGTKIDALTPVIMGVETHIISSVETNTGLLETMTIQNAADLSTILNEFDTTNTKLDGVITLIGSIQNNTTARFVVPERLVKPATGTKNYEFHLHVYDTTGAPTTPDTAPTITVRRLDTGLNVVTDQPMTLEGTKVGAYYYSFGISSSTSEYPALVEAAVTEGGVTRYLPAVTEVTEFESDLNAIQSSIAAMDIKVTDTQSKINNPTFGLSALKDGEGAILDAIANETAMLAQVKAKTDLLPANIATTTGINNILMQIAALPTLSQITNVVHNSRDAIMGPNSRNITQVYDLWDISTLAKTNDPRFNYLDASISSRSTLVASGVWSFGTRTLTDYQLGTDSVKAIWDYLCSQTNVPGSIGKRISDMLDVAVSSRANRAEMITLLEGVAQESTLLETRSAILDDLEDVKMRLTNITNNVLLIKAKTDNLPTNPASETTVTSEADAIKNNISQVQLEVDQIKVKTDNLPVDPASQTAVRQIPTNPLLATDVRINNLDTRVSTRSTLTTANLADLSTKTDVLNAKGQIIAEVDQNQSLIQTSLNQLAYIKNDVRRIPLHPATIEAISAAETAILEAIAQISVDVDGIDPADIWSYAHRTLTQDPESFGPDISHLATKDDVLAAKVNQYANRMTTSFNPVNMVQEVLVWAEKNGERVPTTSSCNIIVKDSLGEIKWTQSSSVPSADGVYRFINPIVIGSDANYYIVMAIVVDGATRVSQQAFITVG